MKEPDSMGFISLVKHISGLDLEYAVESMGGSESLYEKTLLKAARLIPQNVERMDESLNADGGLDVFTIMVHGVKGSLRQIGCLRLAECAELLENAARAGQKDYCDEHYGMFRDELLHFHAQVNEAVVQNGGQESDRDSENADSGNINDFFAPLALAKKAAEDYDSIVAAEILIPLTRLHFGGNTDVLISKASDALEVFKPRQALEYIAELINECERPACRPGKEEGS